LLLVSSTRTFSLALSSTADENTTELEVKWSMKAAG